MKLKEAIRTIADDSGNSFAQISKILGNNKDYLNSTLGRNTELGTYKVSAIADICGYKLVLVPDSHVPNDAVVIDKS